MTISAQKPFESMTLKEKIRDREMRLQQIDSDDPTYAALSPSQAQRVYESLHTELMELRKKIGAVTDN
jgi:hypothetical protein